MTSDRPPGAFDALLDQRDHRSCVTLACEHQRTTCPRAWPRAVPMPSRPSRDKRVVERQVVGGNDMLEPVATREQAELTRAAGWQRGALRLRGRCAASSG